MFNEFEGNADERLAKQEERLRLLKNLHESGYFDEEGIEKITTTAGAGTNPCDPDPRLIFTGESPEPKPGVFKRPMSVSEAEYKWCWRCKGAGDLITYDAEVERCPECGGTGQDDTRPCLVCDGQGHGVHGQACPHCGGRGLEPA